MKLVPFDRNELGATKKRAQWQRLIKEFVASGLECAEIVGPHTSSAHTIACRACRSSGYPIRTIRRNEGSGFRLFFVREEQ